MKSIKPIRLIKPQGLLPVVLRSAVVALTASVFAAAAMAQGPVFTPSDVLGWKSRSFDGETQYQLQAASESSPECLLATVDGGASARYLQQRIDLRKTPVLRWRWRVDNIHPSLDPTSKAGDDYAARVYVVVRRGFLPWQTLALNYMWANGETGADWWPNPFTEKAAMVPVAAGSEGLGQWREQSVNVREDLQRIFGIDVDFIDGIALMSDGDNAKVQSTACYGEIGFVSS